MIFKHNGQTRLLEIDNLHCEDAEDPPPHVEIDPNTTYVSYFENFYGEQWVFIGDRKTKEATLRGGDVGWDRFETLSPDKLCPQVIIGVEEQLWIIACWVSLTHEPFSSLFQRYSEHAAKIEQERAKQILSHNEAVEVAIAEGDQHA